MSTVLITVTGPDRPGVTGVLFTVLSAHGVEVRDVEQVVIRGALTLGVLVATDRDPEGLQERVEQAMASMGMAVRVVVDPAGGDGPAADPHRAGDGPAAAGQGDRGAGPPVR